MTDDTDRGGGCEGLLSGEWRSMKNNITRAVICWIILLQIFGAMSNCAASEDPRGALEISFYTGKAGNVFGPKDVISLTGKYRNNSGSPCRVITSVQAVNSKGEEVWRGEKEIVIPPNAIYNIPFTPEGEFSGMYTFRSAVTDSSGTQSFSLNFFAAANALRRDGLGTCTHFAFAKPTVSTDDVLAGAAAGVSIVRDECWWGDVELEKGAYAIPARVKRFVEFAGENGLEVLMPLTYGNRLYCDVMTEGPYAGSLKMPHTDEQIAAYAKYCAYVAEELRDRVRYFEIWNEPDGYGFNHDLDNTGQPETYAKLLKAAYQAIKAVNPEAYILGLAGAGASQSQWFISRVLEAGGGAYMDALSVHPYIWTREPLDEVTKSFEYEMNSVQSVMQAHGIDKPIWATEVGYSSGDVSDSEEWLTDEQQGAYDVRTCLLSKADGRAEKLFLYELKDRGAGAAKTDNMGIVGFDGTPKPAYYMLAAYNDLIGGAAYRGWLGTNLAGSTEDKYGSDDDGIRYSGYSIHRFADTENDREIFVMWTKGGIQYNTRLTAAGAELSARETDGKLYVDLGGEQARKDIAVYDAYGNKADSTEFTLDFKPVYVVVSEPRPRREAYYSMTLRGDSLVVGGYAGSSEAMPAIKAVEHIYDDETPVYYMDQTRPDSQGYFEFEIPLADAYVHKLYLSDGLNVHTDLFSRAAAVEIYRDREPASDLEGLQKDEEITVRVTLADAGQTGQLVGALYSGTGELLTAVDAEEAAHTDGSAAAEVKLTVQEENQIIKIFMMDPALKPLFAGMETRNGQEAAVSMKER